MDGVKPQENECSTVADLFNFSDDVSIPKGGQKSKETAQTMFNKIFKMEVFGGETADGGTDSLGSHSIRKFAATHARRSGCTKDDKDIRGRWKSKARVSDVYETQNYLTLMQKLLKSCALAVLATTCFRKK
ncbi:hypothetical protein MHU86_25984 [Fragilaria crotonensis]|nr:hypothetical protein MHU86_25984 [Fragilaria crotonensis]